MIDKAKLETWLARIRNTKTEPRVDGKAFVGLFEEDVQTLITLVTEAEADKKLINRITEVCTRCNEDGSCAVCDGSGVVPVERELRDFVDEVANLVGTPDDDVLQGLLDQVKHARDGASDEVRAALADAFTPTRGQPDGWGCPSGDPAECARVIVAELRHTWKVADRRRMWRTTNANGAVPDDIRALGWTVAVHNDYRLDGEPATFWLFTKDGRAVKGEGRSDADALDQVRLQIGKLMHQSADDEDRGMLHGHTPPRGVPIARGPETDGPDVWLRLPRSTSGRVPQVWLSPTEDTVHYVPASRLDRQAERATIQFAEVVRQRDEVKVECERLRERVVEMKLQAEALSGISEQRDSAREAAAFLRWTLARKACGCIAADCRKHGAYVPEECDRMVEIMRVIDSKSARELRADLDAATRPSPSECDGSGRLPLAQRGVVTIPCPGCPACNAQLSDRWGVYWSFSEPHGGWIEDGGQDGDVWEGTEEEAKRLATAQQVDSKVRTYEARRRLK